MIRHLRTCGLARLGLAAVAVLALVAGEGRAETLLFKNNTPVPVVIQGACVVQGVVRRDKPILLRPGDLAKIALPGPKIISLYDPSAPNRLLFQGAQPASNEDLAFLIQFDPKQIKFIMEPVKPQPKK
jgi:hypothetical protein